VVKTIIASVRVLVGDILAIVWDRKHFLRSGVAKVVAEKTRIRSVCSSGAES